MALPLSRNQLVDVQALTNRAVAASVSHHSHVPRTPTALAPGTSLFGAPTPRSSGSFPSFASSSLGDANPLSTLPSRRLRPGCFIDVVSHEACASWSLTERALYLAWWAFRPNACRSCGSHDRWLPSAEDEYQCDHCATGNGSTRTHDIVEDIGNAEDDNDGDSSGDGGEGGGGGGASAFRGGHGSVALHGAALVSLFSHYLGHLLRLPPQARPPTLLLPAVMRAAAELSELVPLPTASEQELNGSATEVYAASSEDEHPATLVRTAALYLAAAVLCPGLVPFPQFLRAASDDAPSDATTPALTAAGDLPRMNSPPGGPHPGAGASLATRRGGGMCQWMDVAAMATQLGFTLPDFFDHAPGATAFLGNIMTLIQPFTPASVAWAVEKDEQRVHIIMNDLAPLRDGGRRTWTAPHPTALPRKQRLSPEHTAVCVAIELVALYQNANPHCPKMTTWYADYAPTFLPSARLGTSGGHCPPAVADDTLLPASTWANLLLHVFAFQLLDIHPLELCELVVVSGLFRGPIRFFDVLASRVGRGFFDLPLQRRLRPFVSPWTSLFNALHSEDRLELMSALQLAAHRSQGGQREEHAACELVQLILRKHGSLLRYQFNYGLRVTDPSEKHVNGLYFCSHVSTACSVFTCLRSGKKTVTFDAARGEVTLSYLAAKTRTVPTLECEFVGPVVAHIEDTAAKLTLDLVKSQLHEHEWAAAQRRLVARELVRRRLVAGATPRLVLSDLRAIIETAGAQASGPSHVVAICGMAPSEVSEDFLAFTARQRTFECVEEASQQQSKLFSAAMSGQALQPLRGSKRRRKEGAPGGGGKSGSGGGGGASSGSGQEQGEDAAEARAVAMARHVLAHQRKSLLASLERRLLLLPAAELVSGYPVAMQLEMFAQLHALCEAPHVPLGSSEDPEITAKIAALAGDAATATKIGASCFRLGGRAEVEEQLKAATRRYHEHVRRAAAAESDSEDTSAGEASVPVAEVTATRKPPARLSRREDMARRRIENMKRCRFPQDEL